jgi:hypothetical protein
MVICYPARMLYAYAAHKHTVRKWKWFIYLIEPGKLRVWDTLARDQQFLSERDGLCRKYSSQ